LFFYTQREPPIIEHVDQLNFQRSYVIKEITEPYFSGKPFRFKNKTLKPSEVADILIKSTPQKVSEIMIGYNDDFVFGKNVTEEFLQRKKDVIKETKSYSKKVFIVHGRDHKPMKELKTMLQGFGLNPIVLHEQPGGSRTIVEKLEKHSDVSYVFVILTPDDVGSEMSLLLETSKNVKPWTKKPPLYRKKELNEMFEVFNPRARQNVILEFGFFIGALKRDRVCVYTKEMLNSPQICRELSTYLLGNQLKKLKTK